MEVVLDLFKEYDHGVIPFRTTWTLLVDKTNGHYNQYKDHELETEMYGPFYKSTIAKMLMDKFDTKDPETRNSQIRYLVFDKVNIKKDWRIIEIELILK